MRPQSVGVISTSNSNYQSIVRAFTWIDVPTINIEEASDFQKVSHIVLPGVSTFGSLMHELESRKFVGELESSRKKGKYILGLCAGMQVLGNRSEENQVNGLGWIDFECSKIHANDLPGIRTFHTGWNDVLINSRLLKLSESDCFYFNHSYYAINASEEVSSGTTVYGLSFSSIVEKDNVIGAQFHPEKSQSSGLKFLKKFSGLRS